MLHSVENLLSIFDYFLNQSSFSFLRRSHRFFLVFFLSHVFIFISINLFPQKKRSSHITFTFFYLLNFFFFFFRLSLLFSYVFSPSIATCVVRITFTFLSEAFISCSVFSSKHDHLYGMQIERTRENSYSNKDGGSYDSGFSFRSFTILPSLSYCILFHDQNQT